jgi:purine-binding chemotaxis protein CheW
MALDLRRRFQMEDRAHTQAPMNVVVRTGEGAVSLLVDEIGDVVEVELERFEPPPATLKGEMRELLHGAYKLPGRLLLEIDVPRAIAVEGAQPDNR